MANFLVCSLISIEYNIFKTDNRTDFYPKKELEFSQMSDFSSSF